MQELNTDENTPYSGTCAMHTSLRSPERPNQQQKEESRQKMAAMDAMSTDIINNK